MKFATCLVAAVLTMASLSACGDDGGDDDAGTGSDPTSEESSESPDEATEPTDEPEPTEDGGGGGEYCDQLRAAKDQLDAVGGPSSDVGEFEQVFSDLRNLGDDAPSEVADDWQVLIAGFDTLEQALSDAGLSMGDLADAEAMQDLDPQALQELTKKLEALDSKQFDQAGENIERHAKAECGFALDD